MARDRSRPASDETETQPGEAGPNPIWFKPVMFGFMIIGLAWIIVFYVSKTTLPIPTLSNWNILIGFGIMMIGFAMTTRWR